MRINDNTVLVGDCRKKVKFGKIALKEAEIFIISTSGGTALSVLLRAPLLIEKIRGGDIPTKQAEDAIQKIRKILREKKS
jgi:hypothetical protein